MKTQHTNKLFWNKFTHKISIKIPFVSTIRYLSKDDLADLITAETFEVWMSKRKVRSSRTYFSSGISSIVDHLTKREKALWKNRFLLYKLITFLNDLKQHTEYTKRTEGDYFNLFLNDHEQFEKCCRLFPDNIRELVWPKDDNIASYLLTNPKINVVKQLPYKKYKYKVNLKSYYYSEPKQIREWLANYDDIKISDTTISQLEKGRITNGKFLYVTNNKSMLLLQMYLGDIFRDITEFKLESEINE